MKRTRDHGGEHAGHDTRRRGRAPRGLRRRMAVVGLAFAALTLGTPLVSATADPEPSLRQLAK